MIRSKGYSIVELLIAMAIGLFIIAGVTQVMLDGRRNFTLQNEMSFIQENARFAKDMMTRDIRMAGYEGCAYQGITIENTLKPPADDEFSFGQTIKGYTYAGAAWTPALTDSLTAVASIDTKSDILALGGIYGGGHRLATLMPNTSADLKLVAPSSIEDDDIIFITDCRRGAIAQVTNITTSGGASGKDNLVHNTGGGSDPGNSTKTLTSGTPFGTDASVYRFEIRQYYVADSAVTGAPALWRKVNRGTPVELISGVEKFSIEYGIDTDATSNGSVNRYLSSDDITLDVGVTPNWIGWDRAVSVRVNLVLRSDQIVYPDNQSVTIDGVTYNDRFLRQKIAFTTRIRNRIQEI